MGGKAAGVAKQVLMLVVTLALVVASVLWLSNFFGEKIPASAEAAAASERPGQLLPAGARVLTVDPEEVPLYRTAIGTVQPVTTADIGSRLMAAVDAVHVNAGMQVEQGQVLVELDDEDLKAKVLQAEAELARAQAGYEQARRDFEKQQQLHERGATSEQEYRRYEAGYRQAEAAVAAARQSVTQAKTVLSWAVVRSPIGGTVIDKMVEAGDMVQPGQTLVRVFNPEKMQLVARVPESLASELSLGQQISVKVDVLPQACIGEVSEIVPEAASQSRTFEVKVTGPCPPGVYSGMFGRLFIPVGTERQIRVPAGAVRTYGQLHQVLVTDGQMQERRFVTVGERVGGQVVVLSGLQAGERIVANYGVEAVEQRAAATQAA